MNTKAAAGSWSPPLAQTHVGSSRQVKPGAGSRYLLITLALSFFSLLFVLPLLSIFAEALGKGWVLYLQALKDGETLAALRLTLTICIIAVPLNTLFGLAAAWAICKFSCRGKRLLISLIDLPLSVSPVVAGLIFVLLFGSHGWLGPWFIDHGMKIIFSVPGIALATIFISFPLVAREIIPLMETQGKDEEEAALILGASGFKTFWHVTLPNIRWALLHGVILCTARVLGEFGAVSVVSGHIRGVTNTLPLQVEILYNEYQFTAAYALASLFALTSLFTLVLKFIFKRRTQATARSVA
jgi:sulfate transport system permease protein